MDRKHVMTCNVINMIFHLECLFFELTLNFFSQTSFLLMLAALGTEHLFTFFHRHDLIFCNLIFKKIECSIVRKTHGSVEDKCHGCLTRETTVKLQ